MRVYRTRRRRRRRAIIGDSQPGLIFRHGWGEIAVRTYGPWLQHLARQGNTVIYPRYQNSASSPPDRVLDDEGNLPPDLWLTDPSVADHYGPERASEAAQAAFWRPLDALAELARRE